MKKNIKKILVLGSAALKIGEAGEFDYSGSQAIKTLKEEGVETILINPNIATIQTSEHLADKVYFLPVNKTFVEKVIQKEKPDGILLGFGGQTALNTGLTLHQTGILEKHGCRVLGTPIETILATEDRKVFVTRLNEIGVKTARSAVAESEEEAVQTADKIGYPVMLRIAFALGGLGSGICTSEEILREKCRMALNHTSQVLIEEYLLGWKEIEYEVVRDRYDNCITVCNMENFDPMGIHTGESIVVAPSQTLTNRDYHYLREVAIKTIRHLGIVGECNIQYAYNPREEDYRVIEVNARLSRSSALASKATGYPLASVATRLSLGYGLFELTNAVTKTTSAFFEPALDYIVVKIPRWDLRKFRNVSYQIGSSMKSVGEVMAIGRSFEEALQKAIRMLGNGPVGFAANNDINFKDLETEISQPTDYRLFAIANALRQGFTVEHIHELSHINPWFLYKLANIISIESELSSFTASTIPKPLLQKAKVYGFSDMQIARICKVNADIIRELRRHFDLHPFVRQIDTMAAEYPAATNYLYLSYNAVAHDAVKKANKSVLILGSGAYRIGSSVEFDWCAVNAGKTLRELSYSTIMLNYNPETVSTDYDEFDVLFFEEISLETIIEINTLFNPLGTIISMGGQIPNNLAVALSKNNIPILGTSTHSIDMAENRRNFSDMLDRLEIDQPVWQELSSIEQAFSFAHRAGYPVLVRPSYVLSGAAMAVASNQNELEEYLNKAIEISPEHPTVISKFYENAKEIEYDAVAQEGYVLAYAISEHVENAGVHSGDATLVFPPQRTYLETMRRIRLIGQQIANELNITGPFNMQVLAKHNQVKVIECNVRASRSFPFVSKIIKSNLIDLATRAIMGEKLNKLDSTFFEVNFVGVKAPQFSFTRLEGADPVTGVEMASTGEVGCLGADFDEAFLKALISVGYRFPIKSILVSSGSIESKADLLESMRIFQKLGVQFFATDGTAKFMQANSFDVQKLYWPSQDKQPNTIEYIKNGIIDLVINIPKNYHSDELTNGYHIRRAAADYGIMLITNRQIVKRLAEALSRKDINELQIKSWDAYRLENIKFKI